MLDHSTIVALGIVAGGALAGLGADVRFKKISDASDRRRIGSEFAKAFLQRVAADDPKGEKIKAVAT